MQSTWRLQRIGDGTAGTRAPVGERASSPVFFDANRRAAAPARLAAAAVDPQLRVADRDCGSSAGRSRWLTSSTDRARLRCKLIRAMVDDALEHRHRSARRRRKRIDAGDEEDLGLEHVADAGDDTLIQQHLRDRRRVRWRACVGRSRRGRRRTRLLASHRPAGRVRAPAASLCRSSFAARQQLRDRHVEADRHESWPSRPGPACRARAAAIARPDGRCASCRSSACACGAPGRRKTPSAGACRAPRPIRWSGRRSDDRRRRASTRETPTRTA